ncbi:MAG: HDOD domain-containing protein [Chloroflexi bacterium]|nr:HDOD domain-containing protein [Chloroflexota bacterium]
MASLSTGRPEAAPARPNVNDLIRRVGELPPLPQVAHKALALIRNPDSSMAELADVLSLDQAMAGLVLRWANSAYYGLVHPVSTVRQAVVYLGQSTIQSLVLTASVAAVMERPAPGYGLDRGELWKHAVGVAAAARLVATRFGRQTAEEAYHAGLLCDIGKLAFEVLLRNVDTNSPEWQGRPFSDLEAAHFGIDHASLGAEMARRWNLPRPLVEAIAYHHRPAQAGEGAILAAAVHVADAAVMALGIGIGRDGLQYALDPAASERLGWSEASFGGLLDRVGPLVAEAEAFIRSK